MKRGRPVKSEIRQNIIEILHFLNKGYGYQIAKIYMEIFPPCTREVIYYHLKKGVSIGEIMVNEIKKEKGEYSWGEDVEKIYYSLGPNAKPQGIERVRAVVDKIKK